MNKIGAVVLIIFFLFAGQKASAAILEEEGILTEISKIHQSSPLSKEHRRLSGLLKESLLSYQSVKNYRTIFHKTERSEKGPGVLEKIYLKFEKPWKIYMGWLNTDKKGLQVVYERGKHDGKLVIHKPGLLLGLAPVIFLDQNSPWVREGSASYDIEDAGIGTFLTDFGRAVIRAQAEDKLHVEFQEDRKINVTFKDSQKNEDYFAYRISVLFDEENKLPVWMELFDWQNRSIGIYEYQDLKINIENDEEFKKQINRHLFRVYDGASGRSSVPPDKSSAVKNNFGPSKRIFA